MTLTYLEIVISLILIIGVIVIIWDIGYARGYRDGMKYVCKEYLSNKEEE